MFPGPYIGFAGAIMTVAPIVEMISPLIPCDFNLHHFDLNHMLVRHLLAFRKATVNLETYYDALTPSRDLPSASLPNPSFPYRTFFEVGAQVTHFTYVRPISESHLLYKCKLVESNELVCVKFRRGDYGEEVHRFCASNGFAPKLHAVNDLSAGWKLVVMDLLDESYAPLFDRVDWLTADERNRVKGIVLDYARKMHAEGYVHGDIRDINVMLSKERPFNGDVQLIDFDWSGREGVPTYPFDVNTMTVFRPSDVVGGAKITRDHDLQMVNDYLFL